MPTQLFDGATVSEVLADIQKKYGEAAKIISARKVSKGGMVGFFGKEWYEVEVEFDGDDTRPPVAPPVVTSAPPVVASAAIDLTKTTSVLDIAEQMNTIEQRIATPNSPSSNPHQAGPTAAPIGPAFTPSFSDVLEAVREESRQQTAMTPTGIRTNVISAKSESVVTQQIPTTTPEPVPEIKHEPVAEPVAEPVTEPVAAQKMIAAPEPVVVVTPEPEVETVVAAPKPVVEPKVEPVKARKTMVAPKPVVVAPEPASSSIVDALLSRLAQKGLPKALLPISCANRTALLSELEQQLQRIPTAPAITITKGTVVAIIGKRKLATETAIALARELNCDVAETVLVSANPRTRKSQYSCVLDDQHEAAVERRSWRRRPRPTIVIVDADQRTSSAWLANMLEAIEPTVTWAMIDAAQKIEDIESWTESFGGVDALAVENTDLTVSPAAVLQLGIPVARIDGRPVSTLLWSALLLEEDA